MNALLGEVISVESKGTCWFGMASVFSEQRKLTDCHLSYSALRDSSETFLVIVGVVLAKTKEASSPLCFSYGDYNHLPVRVNI